MENEWMLNMFDLEMSELMRSFSTAISSCDGHKAQLIFNRALMLQEKINNMEKLVNIEKCEYYVTKFGDIVFSQSDLEYWDSVYNLIQTYKEQETTKLKKLSYNQNKD